MPLLRYQSGSAAYGRGAGAVADLDGACLPVVDHDEAVAAHARHIRLDDVQSGGGGDGGVDGVAAPLQRGHPSLRRQRMPGGDHSVAPHNHRPVGLEANAVGSVWHGVPPCCVLTFNDRVLLPVQVGA